MLEDEWRCSGIAFFGIAFLDFVFFLFSIVSMKTQTTQKKKQKRHKNPELYTESITIGNKKLMAWFVLPFVDNALTMIFTTTRATPQSNSINLR